jgi:PAS domain S-box-containing protein
MFSLVSRTGEVLYASGRSITVFGYRPEELLAQNTFDLVHGDDRDNSRRALREVLDAPPGCRELNVRVREKSGQWRRVAGRISSVNEACVAAIVLNRLGAEARSAELDQQQDQAGDLAHANAELEYFANAVWHDLREPLRTISMFTQLLVNEARLDSHGKQLAQFIVDGVTRASDLLDGLRGFGVQDLDDLPSPLDMGSVVADVLQDLRHAVVQSRASVMADRLPYVRGNERQLRRVFQNLIVNALKYRSEAPVEVDVTAERMGREWIIKIRDNGIGIAPAHHESVFLPLKRLHGSEVPGAGMGLAICKEIIESSGGRIWVESEPGLGSTFCFTIEAVQEEDTIPDLHEGD